MTFLLGFLYLAVFPAGIAAALAAVLAAKAPEMSVRRRTAIAALVAGVGPVALPIFAVIFNSGENDIVAIPVFALITLGLFIAVIIGLPVAYSIAQRAARSKVSNPEEIFD
jgi:MFS family permease